MGPQSPTALTGVNDESIHWHNANGLRAMTLGALMQYRIDVASQKPDMLVIQQALYQADPAALVDLDRLAGQLRISTWLSTPELVKVVDAAGFAITSERVTVVPSECCGGCGG